MTCEVKMIRIPVLSVRLAMRVARMGKRGKLRVIFVSSGDFTKTVALPPIIKEMARRLGISRGKSTVRTTWVRYIEKTVAEAGVDHSGKKRIIAEKRPMRLL